MLNKNFVNKLLTIAILSICNNYINASDNSVPVVKLRDNFLIKKVNDFSVIDNISNNSTSGSDKNSRNGSPEMAKQNKLNEVEQINLYEKKDNSENNKGTVKYNPNEMWFDYQALFDNTKNTMLEKSDTKTNYVRHTNFNANKIALHALFNSDEFNDGLLDSAMSGNIFSQYMLLDHFTDYVRGIYSYDELESLSDEQLRLVGLNYNWFIEILLSLGDNTNKKIVRNCIQLIQEYPVDESISRSLNIRKEVEEIFVKQ